MQFSVSAQEIIAVFSPFATGDNQGKTVCISETRAAYSAGEFNGEIDFDGEIEVSNTNQNVFFSKLNQLGNTDWLASIKGTRDVFVNKILVVENRVFVGGLYSDSLFIGTDTLVNTVQKGVYIGVYDTLGVYQYALHPECSSAKILDLALTDENELYVVGDFFNEFTFAGQMYNSPLGTNFFVLKYDLSDLSESWFKCSEGSNTNGAKVKIDTNDDVIITGSYGTGAIIEGVTLLDNGTEHNTYVVKFDKFGSLIWVQTIVGLDQIHGFGLEVGDNNDIFVCGEFEMSVSVPDGTTLTTNGLMDGLIYKFNSDGVYQWSRQIGGLDSDTGIDIVKDINGNPILLLNAGRDITFESINMSPNGFNEPLLVKLNKFDGSYIWHKRISSLSQSGVVLSRAIDIRDSIICVVGSNYTGIEFNNTTIDSGNLHDYFMAVLFDHDYAEYVSVKELEQNSLFVYPNPFQSELKISSNQHIKRVEIFTMEGKSMFELKPEEAIITILPNLTSGSYILTVETEHSITTRKIHQL